MVRFRKLFSVFISPCVKSQAMGRLFPKKFRQARQRSPVKEPFEKRVAPGQTLDKKNFFLYAERAEYRVQAQKSAKKVQGLQKRCSWSRRRRIKRR